MKNNKSPGSDGYPIEFFKFFWNDFGHIILRAINESWEDGEFSFTQREGIITLIPKGSKDRRHIKNWRPITLLNTVYKIASSCIANKIKKVLPDIISEEQTGFVKGRYIGENIRILYDILYSSAKNHIPGLLVLVDFEKAFDTISRDFIVECLDTLGFDHSLIRWIQVLNNKSSAKIIQNGYLTDSIDISRGCRQGDPVSSFLFVIGAQFLNILAHQNRRIKGIRLDGKEYMLSQFADDTQFILDGTEESLNSTLQTLQFFEKISGLKVNVDKTRLIWFGSKANSATKLCKNYNLDWNQDPFKVLGITFTADLSNMSELNYDGISKEIKNNFKIWARRQLTLFGKIAVIKTLALSKLIYYLINLPRPPDNVLAEINNACFQFLWSGKRNKIRKEVVIKDHTDGGLSMVDLFNFDKALKLTWIRRVFQNSSRLKHLSVFNTTYEIMYSTGGHIDAKTLKNANPFWDEVGTHWNTFLSKLEPPTTQEGILHQALWKNAFHSDKTLFDREWHTANIRFISDIINQDGKFKTFSQIQEQYRIDSNCLIYNRLISNIPQSWK